MIESLHNRPFQLPLLTEILLIKEEKKLSLYLIYPELLPDDKLDKLAYILSNYINEDPHMLPIFPWNIIDNVKKGFSVMVIDPNFSIPVGYAKFYPWKRERRNCWFGIRKCLCYWRISRLWNSKSID